MLKFITKKINFKILVPLLLIYFLGFISIYSTTKDLYLNHLINFLIGILLFVAVQLIDLEVIVKKSSFIYLGVLTLLILVYIVGHTALGASRWLKIGEYSLQPSEFAKISVILFISNILSGNLKLHFRFIDNLLLRYRLKNRFLLAFIFTIPLMGLVLIQPDLGTTISIFLVFIGMLFVSNFDKKYFLVAFILLGIFSSPLWDSLQDYQKERVLVFLNPQMDPYGSGYNTIQAQIAVGSGGFLGKGYAKGTQTQLNFLPIFWTDFLVATYAEEWGFMGLIFLISIYYYLFFQIYKTFSNTKVVTSKFISFGILIYFLSQFLINFGMNIGVLPVTGIPAPLFSYGGTALMSAVFLLGVVNKISLDKTIDITIK